VATYSTVLGLKLNDASDPFQLSDFIANWQVLDASPGTFICTSTSRPSWGTAQAGRMIFMKDLKQTSYWDGASWNDLRNAAPMFAGGFFLNAACNPGSTGTFNLLTLTTPRPSSLAIWASATYTCDNDDFQSAQQAITFDGTPSLMGSFQEAVRPAGDDHGGGTQIPSSAASMTMIPAVTAGQHQVGLRVQVSNRYFDSMTLVGVKILALVSVYATGNSL
jgi:hypothetical protein